VKRVVIGLVALVAAGGALALALAVRGGNESSIGDPQRLIDPVHGVIGGVRVRETRAAAERLLGSGTLVKHHREQGGSQSGPVTFEVEQVHYASSALDVIYVEPLGKPAQARVFAILTHDRRYHTPDGLRAGSSLAAARREKALTCSNLMPSEGYADCQGGLGYERPVTNFQVRGGVVAQVAAISVAD
jgi:hypothetical protein